MKSLNEGIYVTNVIVPVIQTILKNLPLGKSTFVSSSKHQSSASVNRKGDGQFGRWLDIMIIIKHNKKNYKPLFIKCSHLSCIA